MSYNSIYFKYIATFFGSQNPISLGKNFKGATEFQLPHGPREDGYRISIYVDIYDDSDGKTRYYFEEAVIVTPDQEKLNRLIEEFIDPNNTEFIDSFKNATIKSTSAFILSLTAMVNFPITNSIEYANGSNETNSVNDLY